MSGVQSIAAATPVEHEPGADNAVSDSENDTGDAALNDWPERPLDRTGVRTEAQIDELEYELADAGAYILPYPFRRMASIVSDTDFSSIHSCLRFLDDISFRLNLDFGDSFFLTTDRDGTSKGSSTYLPRSSGSVNPQRLATSEAELLDLVRLGFLDHVHGPAGARVMAVDLGVHAERHIRRLFSRGTTWVYSGVAEFVSKAVGRDLDASVSSSFPVNYVVLVFRHFAGVPETVSARLVRDSGRATPYEYVSDEALSDGGHRLVLREAAGDPLKSETMSSMLERVEISIRGTPGWFGEPPELESCRLHNLLNVDVLEAFEQLRDGLGYPLGLWTDHSSNGFLTESSLRNNQSAWRVTGPVGGGVLLQHRPGVHSKDSLLLDVREAVTHCLDKLVAGGLRFVNSSGMSGQPVPSLHPLEVESMGAGRDGTRVGVVRRILPACHPDDPTVAALSKKEQRKSRYSTLGARLASVVEDTDGGRFKAYPIYTHAGAVAESCDGLRQFASDEVYAKLQDSQYNLSGNTAVDERLLFWRASAFYDYMNLVGSKLVGNMKRRSADSIEIERLHDDLVNPPAPIEACRLHGLSFDVASAASATVAYAGDTLTDVLRVGAHLGLKREIVTILEGGIRAELTLRPCEDAYVAARARFDNVLGNLLYIGVADLNDAWRSQQFAIRIRDAASDTVIELGPSRPAEERVSGLRGTATVEDWSACGPGTVWFALYLLSWSGWSGQPIDLMRGPFEIELLCDAVPSAPPPRIVLMKPYTHARIDIETERYSSFIPWKKMMLEHGTGTKALIPE